MRTMRFLIVCLLTTACTQSPEDKQAGEVRSQAAQQAANLKDRAEGQARPLDQQASALANEAKAAGGYEGKRLDVQAHALKEQAKLIRQQADEQSAAIKEGADARIKARRSR